MSEKAAKLIRRIALVLLGLAVAFTLLGGLGSTCVAFNAEKYGKAFEKFISYKSEYQMMVYISLVTAMVGIIVTYALLRGRRWAYAGALLVLLVGLAAAGVQMYYTSTIKQVSFFKTPPTNMRFYTTLVTLVVFLLLGLPGIRKRVDFVRLGSRGPSGIAGGLTAIAMGLLTITTSLWAGPSHMLEGHNLVDIVEMPLLLGGLAMIGAGLVSITWARCEALGLGLPRRSAEAPAGERE